MKHGHDEDKTAFIENAQATLDARFEAFMHYVEQDDWGLFFGVIMATDRVNHFLFKDYTEHGEYSDEFLNFYRTLDEYLGRLREALADDVTMVVASDHGFTNLDYVVHCNTWLEDNGWLSYSDDDHDSLADSSDTTRAYALIPGRFYINLQGREPRGAVTEADYEQTRSELKQALEALEGPDGRTVCARVVESEAVYQGIHDDIAPDLVAIPNPGFDLKAGFNGHEAVFGDSP